MHKRNRGKDESQAVAKRPKAKKRKRKERPSDIVRRAFKLNGGYTPAKPGQKKRFRERFVLGKDTLRFNSREHFVLRIIEPVFLALILWIFFKERISRWTVGSIAGCLLGVLFLCNPGEGAHISARGIALVIFSALTYGVYMAMINKSRIRRLSGPALTFYSLLFGQIVFAARTVFFTEVQAVPSGALPWVCVVGISIVPTIISLMSVAVAIQHIGSVPVAILGALEPITGILFGCLLFGEVLTVRAAVGIVVIIAAVIVLVMTKGKG